MSRLLQMGGELSEFLRQVSKSVRRQASPIGGAHNFQLVVNVEAVLGDSPARFGSRLSAYATQKPRTRRHRPVSAKEVGRPGFATASRPTSCRINPVVRFVFQSGGRIVSQSTIPNFKTD